MGLFTRLPTRTSCPKCGTLQEFALQFKYGATRQFDYGMGEQLRWGFSEVGSPGKPFVLVSGIAENTCTGCGGDPLWFVMELHENRLAAVWPAREGETWVEPEEFLEPPSEAASSRGTH